VNPRRNDPCACGSGKKYKKCCGQTAAQGAGGAGRRGNPATAPRALTAAQMPVLAAHSRAGRYPELECCARELLTHDPDAGVLWKVLGVAMWAQGKDALPELQRAARLLPGDPETHGNLGNAYRARGRLQDALSCHRRALSLSPDYAEAHNNLGSVLRDLGGTEEAVASYRRAVTIRGDFAMAHSNLGKALQELGQPGAAVTSYRKVVRLQPDESESHNRLASALCDLGHFEEAAASCRRALALNPCVAEVHSNLAMVLMLQNQTVEAEHSCRRALELDPSLTAALVLRAELHAAQGEFAQAEEMLRRALAIDPDLADAWAALGRCAPSARASPAWLGQVQRLLGGRLAPRREIHLRYALGQYFDDAGDFEQAFAHFRRANELTRSQNPRHDRHELAQQVDLTLRRYDRKWLSRAARAAPGSERAVFVVGMWRSGTSLAEQILASHPSVFGAGEVPFWKTAAPAYERAAHAGETHSIAVGALASDYLALLENLGPQALRVVDKMSSNFFHLGLIHAALPHARIIHMRRDPIDTCLSIYFQDFLGAHLYANDLGDLAHYYEQYVRLMEHWQRTLTAQAILEVPYEGLVENQEAWSRRMLEFIGLPWDPRCLEFHRTRRTVTTSSKWQVRQSISRSSVQRWRNYAPFLAPLLPLARVQ
jgi:tetratricopeptide (TPR) repeat protein